MYVVMKNDKWQNGKFELKKTTQWVSSNGNSIALLLLHILLSRYRGLAFQRLLKSITRQGMKKTRDVYCGLLHKFSRMTGFNALLCTVFKGSVHLP